MDNHSTERHLDYSRTVALVRAVGSVALLCLSVSCSRSELPATHAFHIHTVDGVQHAVTSGASLFRDELFSYEKVLEIRPDSTDERSYMVGPNPPTVYANLVFVPDSGEHRILVFSIDGQFLRDFGQPGEGPGDLRAPTHVEIVDGKLVVTSGWSSRGIRQRIHWFSLDGSFLDVYTESPEEALSNHRWAVTEDGRRVGVDFHGWWDGDRYYEQSFATVMEGVADTVAFIATVPIVMAERQQVRVRGQVRTVPVSTLYNARQYLGYQSPGRIVSTRGTVPLIRAYSTSGELVRVIEVDIPPEPVTAEDREHLLSLYDNAIERAREHAEESGDRFQLDHMQLERESLSFPKTKAYWTWAMPDDAGFIWLYKPVERPFDANSNNRESLRVLDPRGEYLGDTQWPAVTSAFIHGGYLSAIVTDYRTGERVPMLFRIRPIVAGLEYP